MNRALVKKENGLRATPLTLRFPALVTTSGQGAADTTAPGIRRKHQSAISLNQYV
jgi:hypothetical protein